MASAFQSDIFQADAAQLDANLVGLFATTEDASDSIVVSGITEVQSTAALTESTADILVAGGEVQPLAGGSLDVVESSTDTLATVGAALVAADLTTSDTSDIGGVAGVVVVVGASTSVENPDSAASSGETLSAGALTSIDVGDNIALTGNSLVLGGASSTEVNADVSEITGLVQAAANLVISEAGVDAASAAAVANISGVLAGADAGPDTFYAVPWGDVSGDVGATEGSDIVIINAATLSNGAIGAIESFSDSCTASFQVFVNSITPGGGVNPTSLSAPDVSTMSGVVTTNRSIGSSESGSDTFKGLNYTRANGGGMHYRRAEEDRQLFKVTELESIKVTIDFAGFKSEIVQDVKPNNDLVIVTDIMIDDDEETFESEQVLVSDIQMDFDAKYSHALH